MWSALLVPVLVAAASASASAAAAAADASTEAGTDFVAQQLHVLTLFINIQQPVLSPEQEDVLKSFKWESLKDKFKDPTLLERFMYWYDNGVFLGRNKDFSITYRAHFWQMKQMFKILHSATDFDTFFKMAVWMRSHMNQRMFLYALYTAVRNREDTRPMRLPPPYEIFPQYFVTSDVMQMAYDARLRGLATDEYEPFVIRANYTGWMGARDEESVLSYFRESVELAYYWSFLGYKYPAWMNSTDSPQPIMNHRGKLFYTRVRNLLARYDMERYSRGLPPVRQAELWEPVEGYDPQIRHQSGHKFPARPAGLKPKSTDALTLEDLMDWEGRLRAGIAMSIYLDDKVKVKNLNEDNAMEIIGRILNGGADSPNTKYYGSIYNGLLTIFGHIMDPYHEYGMAPSALDIPETMTRDPLFYRILKRMWKVMDGYKDTLPPYSKNDLIVPGVKIESLYMEKLMTFFDDFDIGIDNAIDVQSYDDAGKTTVVARQRKLDFKSFSYLLKISSDREMTAMVRIFLGPGDGSGHIWTGDDMRHYFYLLDAFERELTSGENSVVCNSRTMFLVGHDLFGLSHELQMVNGSLERGEKLAPSADKLEGFPHHLLLPQGRREGLPATLVAIVTESKGGAWRGQKFTDRRDPFFPMDRRLFLWELKNLPNAHVQQLNIFHSDVPEHCC